MTVVALSGEHLRQRLSELSPPPVEDTDGGAVWVHSERVGDVARFLRDDPDLDFQFLNSISAVDFVDHFQVVYHLTSLSREHTGVVRTRLYGRNDLTLPSVCGIWRGANFQEREIWDLMGIRFDGHPNMKRILLWEGFEGHPLRKDYL